MDWPANNRRLCAGWTRAGELGFRNLKFKARVGDPIHKLLDAVAKANPDLVSLSISIRHIRIPQASCRSHIISRVTT